MTEQRQYGESLHQQHDTVLNEILPRPKPAVTPFKVKWPSNFQLQIIMHQQGTSDAGYNESTAPVPQPKSTAHQPKLNQFTQYRRLAIMTISGINVGAVTALSWLLYAGIASGTWFIALDILLFAGIGPLLWYLPSQLQNLAQNTAEITDLDDYIEEDFF